MFSKEVSKAPSLTVSFVVRGEEVLLGKKKKGFGAGNWNGFGGKVHPGETIKAAAGRELTEEAGVVAHNLEERGKLTFHFDHEADMSGLSLSAEQVSRVLTMHIFVASEFAGEPMETDEMKPQWWLKNNLPFDQMWVDDRYWLPSVLAGQYAAGSFWFHGLKELVDFNLHTKTVALPA